MKKLIATMIATGLTLTMLGCSQPADDGGGPKASGTPKASQTVSVTPTPGQKVEVATGGTEFKPAVPVGSIPDGNWACVMNEAVHYASADKGAGKCTVCGMNLVQIGKEE